MKYKEKCYNVDRSYEEGGWGCIWSYFSKSQMTTKYISKSVSKQYKFCLWLG